MPELREGAMNSDWIQSRPEAAKPEQFSALTGGATADSAPCPCKAPSRLCHPGNNGQQ